MFENRIIKGHLYDGFDVSNIAIQKNKDGAIDAIGVEQ